jgi:hypothetical protein
MRRMTSPKTFKSVDISIPSTSLYGIKVLKPTCQSLVNANTRTSRTTTTAKAN